MAQLLSALPVGALVKDTGTVYNGESPIFRVLEHGHTGDPSGSTTLDFRDVISLRCYDARESNNSSVKGHYGNSRYKYSNILQWLNSSATAGEWYTAQHSSDQPPAATVLGSSNYKNSYDKDCGFLRYLSHNLRKALLTATKTSYYYLDDKTTLSSEDVSSKMFLLSMREVGLTSNGTEPLDGTVYALFSERVDEADDNRVKKIATSRAIGDFTSQYSVGDDATWFTRTPSLSGSVSNYYDNVEEVDKYDFYNRNSAYTAFSGISPAFCIPQTTLVSSQPDSNGVYTIIWSSTSEKIISLSGLDIFKDCLENVMDDKIDDIPIATTSENGLMSSTDKTKLEGIGTISSTYIDSLFT